MGYVGISVLMRNIYVTNINGKLSNIWNFSCPLQSSYKEVLANKCLLTSKPSVFLDVYHF